MMDRELFRQALEAMDTARPACFADNTLEAIDNAITALRSRLAQPEQEFIEHHVDGEGWSEWVCPDPKGYLMKCCDCGLVHEAEFGVVRYKSEAEREDCEPVDDPNLQAVFRMRRSERWSPEDTAHRAGGMSMAQPEQEPVACQYAKDVAMPEYRCATKCQYAQPEQEPVAWMYHGIRHDDTPHERPSLIWKPEYMDVMSAEKGAKATPLYTAPRQWQRLTDEELDQAMDYWSDPSRSAYGGADRANGEYVDMKDTWRYIEAKLKEKNT